MAPKRHKGKKSLAKILLLRLEKFRKAYLNYEYIKMLLCNPAKLLPVACLLVFLECIINFAVFNGVKYTEIDWRAYMQEVEGVLSGIFDYSLLKGDTGPLVYPAGFVWIFSGIYLMTNRGENIRLGQFIFGVLYILNMILVLRIYLKAKKVPPYVLIFTSLSSYRIHSIFILRLFNDPVAIVFFYLAANAFIDSRWNIGSIFFSLAVSIKMNILLFAPALLLAYLKCLGVIRTIQQLAICAGLQIILAIPFLLTHPVNYIMGAFDFGRVFLYQWTVNWRFLPEHVFVDRRFHIALLILHVVLLGIFYKTCSLFFTIYAKLKGIEKSLKLLPVEKRINFLSMKCVHNNVDALSQLLLLPMFLSNFIGVACSRSLHYQFYIWYFHSLPYLLWSTNYSTPIRLSILGIIEMCWNTYPSTSLSSLSLQLCHWIILYGVYINRFRLLKEGNLYKDMTKIVKLFKMCK